jgi:hypothetical protein
MQTGSVKVLSNLAQDAACTELLSACLLCCAAAGPLFRLVTELSVCIDAEEGQEILRRMLHAPSSCDLLLCCRCRPVVQASD